MFSFKNLFRSKSSIMLDSLQDREAHENAELPLLEQQAPSLLSRMFSKLTGNLLHAKTKMKLSGSIHNYERSEVVRSKSKLKLYRTTKNMMAQKDYHPITMQLADQLMDYARYDANATTLSDNLSGEIASVRNARALLARLKDEDIQDYSEEEKAQIQSWKTKLERRWSGKLDTTGHDAAIQSNNAVEDRFHTRTVIHRNGNGKVNGVIRDCTRTEFSDHIPMKNVADQPLFPHKPCVGDVRQGGLGDCYLLASLASLVSASPKNITNMMHDDGNTVTVCFHIPSTDEGAPYEEVMRAPRIPLYVRVSKEVPADDAFAENSLWVQMMERAYAASMIHQRFDSVFAGHQPVQKAKEPPSYQAITGGLTEMVLSMMTGKVSRSITHIEGSFSTDTLNLSNAMNKLVKREMASGPYRDENDQVKFLESQWENFDSKEATKARNELQNKLNSAEKKLLNSLPSSARKDLISRKLSGWALIDAISKNETMKTKASVRTYHGDTPLDRYTLLLTDHEKTPRNRFEARRLYADANNKLNIRLRRSLLGLPQADTPDQQLTDTSYNLELFMKALTMTMNDYTTKQAVTVSMVRRNGQKFKKAISTRLQSAEELAAYLTDPKTRAIIRKNWTAARPSHKLPDTPEALTELETADDVVFKELMDQLNAQKLIGLLERLPALQHEPFSGKYSEKANYTFNAIQEALAHGKPVTASSFEFVPREAIVSGRAATGEYRKDGLLERHAYTVLGVEETRVAAGDQTTVTRFIKLRNPWGSEAREYDRDDKTGRYTSHVADDTGGIFLMELNDYMMNMARTTFSGT